MLRRWFSRLETLFWETYLGISTRGDQAATVPGGTDYSPLAYGTIRRVLDRLELKPDDVLVDVGCGLGRVVCMAARRRITWVWGIEADASLVAAAVPRNTRHFRGTLGQLQQGFAQCFNFARTTVAVMYNPFNASVMQQTLQRMKA